MSENQDYLYRYFPEDFVFMIEDRIRERSNFSYDFFDEDYKCDYDRFINLRDRGYYFLVKNNLEEAYKYLREANELYSQDSNLVKFLGMYFLKKEDYNKAFEQYDYLTKLNPLDIDGFLNKGKLLEEKGKSKEAMLEFQKAIKLQKNNLQALKGLANNYVNLGDFNKGKDIYKYIVRSYPKLNKDIKYRIYVIDKKMIDKLLEEVKSNPNDVSKKYELANLYYKIESYRDCRKVLFKLVCSKERMHSSTYLLLGKAIHRYKTNAKMQNIRYLSKALKLAYKEKSDVYEILFERGLVYFDYGELKKLKRILGWI